MKRPGSLYVRIVCASLRHAFDNVIRNALRYAPVGSAIEIQLEALTGSSRVSVRDFGPGVPPHAFPHLATLFFRAERDRDSMTGGVGLGLAIARRAVLVNHGTFTTENAGPGLRVLMRFGIGACST